MNEYQAGRTRGQRGVTLIELLVALAVLTVLLAIASPSFASLIQSSRLTSTSNELLSALQVARSEAIRRNQRVVACASSNGSSCSGASTWSTGWVVFVDTNRNGAVDTGETLLRSYETVAPLQVNASPAVGSAIVFRADGMARSSTGALVGGRLAVCQASASTPENVRDVNIASGARVTVSRRSATGACTSPSNT